MYKAVLAAMAFGLIGLLILPAGPFGSRRVVTPEAQSEEQLTLVLLSSLSLGRYEIISTKLVGDKYHYTVKNLKTFKMYLVDMGIGPPAPPETPGTQFVVETEGAIEFDVETEGIPPKTTKSFVLKEGETILETLPEGDYELLEVTHNSFASPDHKSTFYVYRLKDLNTGKVILEIIPKYRGFSLVFRCNG